MPTRDASAFARALRDEGYCFVPADEMHRLLTEHGELDDWADFAASWNDLAPDSYLAQVGRQRRRRYGVFAAVSGTAVERQPHQPHYQSRLYNPLQGDIQRWFEPLLPATAASRSLRTILEFSRSFFSRLAPDVRGWHMEVHQFRIEAKAGQAGEPTPEGVHRDGVEYVLVLLIERQNIASGTTTIHSADGGLLGSFTLTHPFDAALVDDGRVYHGVTPVEALDRARGGRRDVLVVTLRRQD